jgi:two-component system chemotaxis sensor kinase CheA
MERQARSLSKQTSAVRRLQQRSAWTMNLLSKQLRQDVWQARMTPAETLFEGSGKMVRDLARDASKEIEFRATSTGVHADRAVLETLKDPVMHVLRNAVSHGIESPQERTAKGKSPVGLVTCRVATEGRRLAITIEDDGRGVDFGRVAEVAVRQGMISEPEAARSSSQELARILFRAGFSTSRSVTELSGRGMGLSVMYEAVRRLRGDVDLQPGRVCGTTLHLSVPLSISAHKLLLVKSGGQLFAIPIHEIERLHQVGRKTVETVEGNPVVTIDGHAVPLFSLPHLLNMDDSPTGGESEWLRIVVVRFQSKRVAIAVDAFLRECDAVIQELGPAAGRSGKISGGILLEGGQVAFVLNPTELLDASAHQEASSFLKPAAPDQEKAVVSILVVDDSMTTRTLEKSILEAHGYRVRVAVDGVEAMEQLRSEKADLVIADVQMPRMDGFELLEAIRKDPHLKATPVIVVTSLDRREDRERGLGLGADAYIVKQKFDQEELLAAIRQIV